MKSDFHGVNYLNKEYTHRGFAIYHFDDLYGAKCSLQKSSLATDDAIWLGVDDANPQIMASKTPQGGTGWVKYDIPDDVMFTTRMHNDRMRCVDDVNDEAVRIDWLKCERCGSKAEIVYGRNGRYIEKVTWNRE
jgi:hypothetical protein